MSTLFPSGFASYALGGVLIGAGAALVHLVAGRVGGMSTTFSALHGLWSRAPFFASESLRSEWRWRRWYAAGIVAGGAAGAALLDKAPATDLATWRLAVGGVLVGFGTRWARGCTSGHGICGLAAGSVPSLVSTAVFVGVAMLTAALLAGIGGGA